MRPLTLRIKGFTSFRDEQTVDFTDLDLFALWGPTGSGKSSVLDAMTYALYGKVDRVEHASALVSQGQPRMSVSLDFSADSRSYRVTRSTPPTKVRLEKLDETGQWQSFGAGADKVTEVNRSLIDLIGLDYLAFTRSVLLPQGKFAEFLAGDATDRRKILTELLGLELFEKMAKRANEIRKEQASQAEIKGDVVGRSFTGVDPESIAAAKGGHDAATKQAGRVADVLVEVERLGEELAQQKASTEAVLACRAEVAALSETFEDHAARLGEIAREGASFRNQLDRANEAVATATETLEAAIKELTGAEKRWGSLDAIVSLVERAKNLAEVTATATRAERSVTEARAHEKQAALTIDSTDDVLNKARAGEAATTEELDRCTAAVDEAHRHDRVGSLVHGASTGDPCPVCERPLEKIPSFDPSELEATAAALKSARARHQEAQGRVGEATIALAVAKKEHATALEQIEACGAALTEARTKQTALTNELAPAFGKALPEDPVAELEQRARALRKLAAAETTARNAQEAAREELAEFDERRGVLQEKTAEIRTRMDSDGPGAALGRIGAAAPEIERPDLSALDSLPVAADALADEAERITKLLKTLGEDLDHFLSRSRSETEGLIQSMRAAVPDEFEVDGQGPVALVGALRELEKKLAARIAVATKEVTELEARLEQRRSLEDEIAHHREQQAAYSDLQKELKADRIVQHLQAEALVVLADAASHHLRELSDSRYRLVYDEDRFYVVDAWNGDEKRNVKTLSGGETFLTSLALALALSEQIQLLSVTEKSRLESLFLDEGFGQLDTDLLDVVVNAIEQMRGADRLVGVVTHVADLAERMPTRLVVSKSPRG
ncbi:MAG: AAA family ATPase, partial [Actinobacteria bacterium]|nr:AAA family ATPase [Actinomycetota bacterium]